MSRAVADKVKPVGKLRPAKDLVRTPGSYWRESETPLASLVFLLPLIVFYECGTGWLTPGPRRPPGQQIIAFVLIRDFFSLFGANARHLPALAVAGILLTWHIARKDSWRINLQTIAGMAAESVALALPVLMLGMVLPRYFPLAGAGHPGSALGTGSAVSGAAALISPGVSRTFDYVVLFCGAGVYEELVFRLALLTFLSLILRDAFQVRPFPAAVLMVLVSGILFSAYHYLSPDEPPFRLNTFVFRSLAGIYFGILFLTRGFGVTAASHAAYDIFVLMLTSHSL